MDLTLEEAKAIMNDPAHPRHSMYLQNEPTVTGEIKGAFQRAFPGSQEGKMDVDGLVIGPSGVRQSGLAELLQKPGGEASGEEAQGENPDLEAGTEELKAEWGDSFQENYDTVSAFVFETFKDDPDLREWAETKFGNDPHAIKLALKLSQRR